MSSIFGRAIIVPKTNKSGGSLAKGDVVVVDSANDNAVTTTTSGATTVTVGVVVEENGIANNASGRVQFGGHVALVNVNASVTRGHYGKTYTVAKQATDAGASRVVGTFCLFTTGGTTPEADLFAQPDASSATGNVATDAIWDAKGDLAGGTGADTAARLAVGTNGYALLAASGETTGLKWAQPAFGKFVGVKAYHSTTQSLNDAVMALDSEEYDTDGFHDTVTNNSRITIPTGFAGYYLLTWSSFSSAATRIGVRKNGAGAYLRGESTTLAASGVTVGTTVALLAAADYVELITDRGASATYGDASRADLQTVFTVTLLGTA